MTLFYYFSLLCCWSPRDKPEFGYYASVHSSAFCFVFFGFCSFCCNPIDFFNLKHAFVLCSAFIQGKSSWQKPKTFCIRWQMLCHVLAADSGIHQRFPCMVDSRRAPLGSSNMFAAFVLARVFQTPSLRDVPCSPRITTPHVKWQLFNYSGRFFHGQKCLLACLKVSLRLGLPWSDDCLGSKLMDYDASLSYGIFCRGCFKARGRSIRTPVSRRNYEQALR